MSYRAGYTIFAPGATFIGDDGDEKRSRTPCGVALVDDDRPHSFILKINLLPVDPGWDGTLFMERRSPRNPDRYKDEREGRGQPDRRDKGAPEVSGGLPWDD